MAPPLLLAPPGRQALSLRMTRLLPSLYYQRSLLLRLSNIPPLLRPCVILGLAPVGPALTPPLCPASQLAFGSQAPQSLLAASPALSGRSIHLHIDGPIGPILLGPAFPAGSHAHLLQFTVPLARYPCGPGPR